MVIRLSNVSSGSKLVSCVVIIYSNHIEIKLDGATVIEKYCDDCVKEMKFATK